MATSGLLVGAIDFGTTYSGWACSFVHEYKSDPTKISVKHWPSGTTLVTEKAPTCALIAPDGETLEAFGYEAENKYRDLLEQEEQEGYYYFKRFKMSLNRKLNEGVARDFMIEDEMYRSLPAMTVFSTVIEYLTTDMVTAVNKGLSGKISADDVVWVLYCTGHMDRLCQELHERGRKAGGTIDVTVHQVTSSGGLKEIHTASGGGWGGILVDKAFRDFITDLVKKKVYAQFVTTETEDWLEFWREFEVKKKSVSPEKDSKVVVKIPSSLAKLCEELNRQSISEAIDSSEYSGQVKVVSDKMKIEAILMRGLFTTSITKTVGHVKTLLRDPIVSDIKAILMVGGFSDSPMLQEAVTSAFPGVTIINPPDAATSVLKGAVIFGHSPKSITERVLKYTYGLKTRKRFKDGVHPPSKRIVEEDGAWCRDLFDKHAEISQTVPVDKACDEQYYKPSSRSQKELTFGIYASQLKNPQFVDEGCTKLGRIEVAIPEHQGDMKNGVYVSMRFGGTEIEVVGRDEVTGEETTATFDFLE